MIIIKNMEMPKHCLECRFSHKNNNMDIYFCSASKYDTPIPFIKERSLKLNRPSWCPLGEVK